MGGRKFAQYNKADPEPVVRLLDKRPPCFDAAGWRLYLLDVHRGTLNDPANRQRLVRGELPDYCAECTARYQEQMQAQGKCCPPPAANHPGDSNVSPDSAARAAERTRTAASVPEGDECADAAGLKPEPTGNARIGFSVPASVFALAGPTGAL